MLSESSREREVAAESEMAEADTVVLKLSLDCVRLSCEPPWGEVELARGRRRPEPLPRPPSPVPFWARNGLGVPTLPPFGLGGWLDGDCLRMGLGLGLLLEVCLGMVLGLLALT